MARAATCCGVGRFQPIHDRPAGFHVRAGFFHRPAAACPPRGRGLCTVAVDDPPARCPLMIPNVCSICLFNAWVRLGRREGSAAAHVAEDSARSRRTAAELVLRR